MEITKHAYQNRIELLMIVLTESHPWLRGCYKVGDLFLLIIDHRSEAKKTPVIHPHMYNQNK